MRRVEIYDTLSREKRLFVPIAPPRVGLFVCGMTPYAESHIGHGRTFVTFDVVARALRHWGYRVFYVQNVTNLDDNVIEHGSSEGVDPLALADRNFRDHLQSMEALGVRSVNFYPYATDYVPEIIEQIRTLVERDFAYPSNGSVYYRVDRFPSYGRLSGQRAEAHRPGTRVAVDPDKRAPDDFVIWKAAKPGEPSWETPWGPGRPGWHIEDTAITLRLFGSHYDLHGAGVDLKFPHHEAEIALAESTTGEAPFVNYWMHSGMLNLSGEKMSKSLGNVVSLSTAIANHGGMVLRFFYLNAQYRGPLDYVEGKSLVEASEAYRRLGAPLDRIEAAIARGAAQGAKELPEGLERGADTTVDRMDELLADDFNTREAVAELFGYARRLGEWLPRFEEFSPEGLETLAAPYRWAQEVLGLFEEAAARPTAGGSMELAIQVALDARAKARERGDFAEADRIRDELAKAGIRLEDDGETTRWELASSPR